MKTITANSRHQTPIAHHHRTQTHPIRTTILLALACTFFTASCTSQNASTTHAADKQPAANPSQSAPNQVTLPTPSQQPPQQQTSNAAPTNNPTPSAQQSPPTPQSTSLHLTEVFPGVRLDRERKTIVLSGTVPIEAHQSPGTQPKPIYLETAVCATDSKEHESLVVVNARPSHVHAALLMLGLAPGHVGTWHEHDNKIIGTPPTGPSLNIRVHWQDALGSHDELILNLVVDQQSGRELSTDAQQATAFVFAGSRFVNLPSRFATGETFEAYAADIDGTIVGLATFSSECIAWTQMHHHQSTVEEPRLIANPKLTPPFGTQVEVIITPKN